MKPLLALLAAMLLGVGVLACGGESKDRASSSGASSKPAGAAGAKGAAPNATTTSGTTNGSSAGDGTSEANDAFTYSHSASPSDIRAITALVNRYYAAAAADNGVKACGLIYSIVAESIPEDYGQPPGPPDLRGKTCAVVMSKLFKHVPNQSPAVLITTKVTGVRLVGSRKAFVRLHSRTMPNGEIMVERERGVWKIAETIGGPCTRRCVNG